MPLGSARAAGERIHAWLDAAASLDLGGVGARNDLQRDRSVGSFPSRSTRSASLMRDLVHRDVVALGRRPSIVMTRLAACAGAWLMGCLFGSTVGAVCLAVALVGLALAVTPRLRTWLASTSLWRMVPQDPRRVSWSLTVVPLIGLAVVGGLVGWAVGVGIGGLAAGFGALTVTLRRHRRPDLQIGQTLDTPLGQLPLGLAMSLFYGSEATIVVLVVGLNVGWWVALAVSMAWFLASAWSARPLGTSRDSG